MANPEAQSSEPITNTDTVVSEGSATNSEAAAQYELQRLEVAKEFAEEIASYLRPGMSKEALESARGSIRTKIVGALMHEYRLGRAHGSNGAHTDIFYRS